MRILARILNGRISTRIVFPYLILAMLLAACVTLVAASYTADSLQARLNNRLIEAGQVTSDGLVAVEDRQLEALRTIAFTEGVAEAVASNDRARLESLLRPIWANLGLQALVVFDKGGRPLLAWERAANAGVADPPAALLLEEPQNWWLMQQIVREQNDVFGDKFSTFRDNRLWTSAPIRDGEQLAGGAMVATPLPELLNWLESQSQAAVTTFYDGRGIAVATTQILVSDAQVPAIPVALLEQLALRRNSDAPGHIQDIATLSGREYQLAYSPLQIRRTIDGYFAIGLPRSFVISAWQSQRNPLIALSLGLLAAVVVVGALVARQITRPLGELVYTARAVAQGDLRRRSTIHSHDEIGMLAGAFNQMTGRLLHLYETSRELGGQSQINAILSQTARSVERLSPGAITLTVLEDRQGWRIHYADQSDERLRRLSWEPLSDTAAVLALTRRVEGIAVAPADARRLRSLNLPPGFAEVAYTPMYASGRLIGMLLLLHEERGMFIESAREPLTAIAGMAAAALHNVLLYQEVQAESSRRTAILQSIADGVIVCDERRNVVLMNPAAEALLAIHDWEHRHYHFSQLPLEPIIDVSALGSGDDQLDARYRCGDRELSASFAGVAGSSPDQRGEVIVLHDISAAAALDRAKTGLIALISHELRTPLTAIHSSADLLRKEIGGPLTPIQRELTDTALRQTQAMSALIEKAVLVAGIEMGTLEMDIQPTGLRTIIDVTVEPLREAAKAAEVDLRVELGDNLPLVHADTRMLRFALHQLLDNAIKYGSGAPVRLLARRHGRGVALAVRDFGPGIPPEQLPNLFERLTRSENALNEAPRGIGLGLVLARDLIERQGGAISVQSQAAQGSLFTIFLRSAEEADDAIAA
ncbi:MAG: HAMP domain-containing protein [Oscillochloris sp.]|nr:HAMP domain-containing protein [Oscillochloris sp.]